jgi:hypothetical protein
VSLVALSASYGAAGSRIAPALAQRLDVPFVDRAIAMEMAESLDVSVDEAIAHEDPPQEPSLLQRLLSGFAAAEAYSAPAPLPSHTITAEDFHNAAREAVLKQARTGRGVILGRGAVAALRDDPRALRVRLSGPAPARIEQAMRLGDPDRETARRALRRLDRAHAEYLRQFYDVDINDPALYHLVLDATVFTVELCVELIALAVEARTA